MTSDEEPLLPVDAALRDLDNAAEARLALMGLSRHDVEGDPIDTDEKPTADAIAAVVLNDAHLLNSIAVALTDLDQRLGVLELGPPTDHDSPGSGTPPR